MGRLHSGACTVLVGAAMAASAAWGQTLTQSQADAAFGALLRSEVSTLLAAFQSEFPRDFARVRERFIETATGPQGASGAQADAIAAVGTFLGVNGSYLHTAPSEALRRSAERYAAALPILARENPADCVKTVERRGGKSFRQSDQALHASYAIDAELLRAIKAGRERPMAHGPVSPEDIAFFQRALAPRGVSASDSARLTSGTDQERCDLYRHMFAAISELPAESAARLFIALAVTGTFGPEP